MRGLEIVSFGCIYSYGKCTWLICLTPYLLSLLFLLFLLLALLLFSVVTCMVWYDCCYYGTPGVVEIFIYILLLPLALVCDADLIYCTNTKQLWSSTVLF